MHLARVCINHYIFSHYYLDSCNLLLKLLENFSDLCDLYAYLYLSLNLLRENVIHLLS